ncbi:hypothetical protein ACHAXT_010471 [Thalassiosira profunda]
MEPRDEEWDDPSITSLPRDDGTATAEGGPDDAPQSKATRKKLCLVALAALAALSALTLGLGVAFGPGAGAVSSSSSTANAANDAGEDGATITLEDCLALEKELVATSSPKSAAYVPSTVAPTTTEATEGAPSASGPADEPSGGKGGAPYDGAFFPLYDYGDASGPGGGTDDNGGEDVRKLEGVKEMEIQCKHVLAAHRSKEESQSTSIIVSYSSPEGLDEVKAHVTGKKGKLRLKGGVRRFRRPQKVKGAKGRKTKGEDGDGEDENYVGAAMLGYVVLQTGSAADVAAEVLEIEALKGVASAERDGIIQALDRQLRGSAHSAGDKGHRSFAESQPWGIAAINVTQLWAIAPKRHVKVCIPDTGYDLGHLDLPNNENVTGTSFIDSQPWAVDGEGHGTHVAGTIAAIGGNGRGVVGVLPDPARISLHITKVLDDQGRGNMTTLLNAVMDCVDNGADVISLSLGCGGPECYSAAVNAAFQDAYDQGVVLVAAAGNSGTDALNYPAGYSSVMSVGAIMESGYLSNRSSRSDQTEIAAPGINVNSTWPNDAYVNISGTSMAAPHVAGVAALLVSHFPECSNQQIRNAMIQSAAEPPSNDARNTNGWEKYYGWGIVDAGAAYNLLSEGCVKAGGVDPLDMGFNNTHEAALGGSGQKTYGCVSDKQCAGSYGVDSRANKCDIDSNVCYLDCEAAGKVSLELKLKTDMFPAETSWMLVDSCSNVMVDALPLRSGLSPNTTYTEQYCVDESAYEFTIFDLFRDGICCSYGSGSYNITYDGAVVASGDGKFGSTETKTFGSCEQTATAGPEDAEETSTASPADPTIQATTVSPADLGQISTTGPTTTTTTTSSPVLSTSTTLTTSTASSRAPQISTIFT